jgi:predicted nucleic acid-binding protein
MILFLDTNIVIYVVEGHPAIAPKAILRLATAQSAGATFMISDLTRMECLIGSLKTNNTAVQGSFHAFFARSDVQVVAITAAVCDRAARIRATYNFKPMDALQLTAAAEHGANVFLTADARLASFTNLTVEVLS